jgi:hypothetical protein
MVLNFNDYASSTRRPRIACLGLNRAGPSPAVDRIIRRRRQAVTPVPPPKRRRASRQLLQVDPTDGGGSELPTDLGRPHRCSFGQPRTSEVTSTSCSSRFHELTEVGQTTRWRGRGLPAGGGDTSADSAACCTLRPKSTQNRGKSAANSWSELATGDATARTKQVAKLAAVWITSFS